VNDQIARNALARSTNVDLTWLTLGRQTAVGVLGLEIESDPADNLALVCVASTLNVVSASSHWIRYWSGNQCMEMCENWCDIIREPSSSNDTGVGVVSVYCSCDVAITSVYHKCYNYVCI